MTRNTLIKYNLAAQPLLTHRPQRHSDNVEKQPLTRKETLLKTKIRKFLTKILPCYPAYSRISHNLPNVSRDNVLNN
ncbi:hypothetical protein D3C76_1742680 [compost metagenome]